MADNRENERMNGEPVGAAGGEGMWPANNKTYVHKVKLNIDIKHKIKF